jgi:preprotein translocase subunit YajC
MNNIWILAQAAGEQGPSGITSETVETEQGTTTTVASEPNAPARPVQRPFGPSNMIVLGLMLVVMYLLLFRGPRKKQQQHRQMVQSLQKNDRVRTIGGIIGTVVDIKDDEVTLKIDESTNTKIKVLSSAIGKNMSTEKS